MIYFDQAASSFPKPKGVTEAVVKFLVENGANPGRSGHRLAREAAEMINQAREVAADVFGCSNPKQCMFYENATIGLNQALKGLNWKKGDHIITTSFEHNSVRRPLEHLKNTLGVEVSFIKWNDNENAFLASIKNAITPKTKLFVMSHGSNVTGDLLPLDSMIKLAKDHHILTLVDASQTAGHISIHMKKQSIDMLAFPGHKGLLGPQGTGMLLIEGEIELNPIHHGGTGILSNEVNQPAQWPEKLESGTLNTPGISGLLAALQFYNDRRAEIVPRETILARKLAKGLKKIVGVTLYGPKESKINLPIVAFNIKAANSQEVAMILDTHYNVAVRPGIHCSPLTHETLETMDQGIVRASLSLYNTEKEVVFFLNAIKEIASSYDDL